MTKTIFDVLEFRNFKTIKDLKIDLNQVNVIIGNPNTGKSNLLEAISMLNILTRERNNLDKYIRMTNIQNLFTNELIDNRIELIAESSTQEYHRIQLQLNFANGQYQSEYEEFDHQDNLIGNQTSNYDYEGNYSGGSANVSKSKFARKFIIKFYKYKELSSFSNNSMDFLLPPFGENLFQLAYGRSEFREFLKDFIKTFDVDIVFRPQEKRFEIQKQINDTLINLPYETLADTIKQIIFYTLAIKSNSNSLLLFEEPEGHTFPYYTKYLAQLISNSLSNQYVTVTHNPYFLRTLIEKIPQEKLSIFIAYLDNYNTKLYQVSENQKEKMLETDPFFNLEDMVE